MIGRSFIRDLHGFNGRNSAKRRVFRAFQAQQKLYGYEEGIPRMNAEDDRVSVCCLQTVRGKTHCKVMIERTQSAQLLHENGIWRQNWRMTPVCMRKP